MKKKSYWYFTYLELCPDCLHEERAKERREGPKPKKPEDCIEVDLVWDGCGAL